MMKSIMTVGAAAVALAASALLAQPAQAQDSRRGELRGGPGIERGFDDRRGFRSDRRSDQFFRIRDTAHFKQVNEFGQTAYEVQLLKDKAYEECLCQLEIDAAKYGFDRARLNVLSIEQIGPRGFQIYGQARLRDGRKVGVQDYDCTVRRGRIRYASEIDPSYAYAGRRGHRRGFSRTGFGFSFSGW